MRIVGSWPLNVPPSNPAVAPEQPFHVWNDGSGREYSS